MENSMRRQTLAPKGRDGFPDSHVPASDLLIPITCWSEMICESRITGTEFDQFWYESVKDGVANFFRWLGVPRATVLVVHDNDTLSHIECRTLGDLLVPQEDAEPIIAEVIKQFQTAGFWRNLPAIDNQIYPSSTLDDQQAYLDRLAHML